MPTSVQDYVFALGGRVGVWVELVNNATGVGYVSSSATGATGKFTIAATIPGGYYTVYTAKTQLAALDPGWVVSDDTSYIVPYTAGDAIVGGSFTALANGPYGVDPRIPAGGGIAIPQTVDKAGRIDWSGGVGSTVYGVSTSTGLSVGQTSAVIKVEASTAAFLNDASHDINAGILAANWTANGAAIVADNRGTGDGIYAQTIGTAAGTSYAVNVFAGDATHQTAPGIGIHIARFGTGYALQAASVAGSTGDLINLQQVVNARTIGILSDTGSTTTDTVAITALAKTNGNIINLFQNTSAFTGAGILMNFAGGSGTFTGKFESFQVNNIEKWSVDSTGLVNYGIGVTALGGGAAPTLGTIGATGPAAAAQNSWLKVNIGGTASFIPVWR